MKSRKVNTRQQEIEAASKWLGLERNEPFLCWLADTIIENGKKGAALTENDVEDMVKAVGIVCPYTGEILLLAAKRNFPKWMKREIVSMRNVRRNLGLPPMESSWDKRGYYG